MKSPGSFAARRFLFEAIFQPKGLFSILGFHDASDPKKPQEWTFFALCTLTPRNRYYSYAHRGLAPDIPEDPERKTHESFWKRFRMDGLTDIKRPSTTGRTTGNFPKRSINVIYGGRIHVAGNAAYLKTSNAVKDPIMRGLAH